jgi:8-oxo-dGTP pyrophosphatase MutT (NUDIX family)
MRAYYLFGILISPFAKIAFFAYSLLTGTKRVRIVVFNEQGELLLLKTWLGANKWGLPGGGVERGEPLESAAARELVEETGIEVAPSDLRELFILRDMGHDEMVFTVEVPKQSLPVAMSNRLEVRKVVWIAVQDVHSLDSLTERILSRVASTS